MRVVVAGAGEVGRHLAGRLTKRGADVVLVDADPAALATAEDELDVMTLCGDMTHRRVLAQAEVASAAGFAAVSGSDTANLLSATLAKSLGARVAVARADAPALYLTRAAVEHGLLGIDHVLCATRFAAAELLCHIDRIEDPFVEGFAQQRVRVALWSLGDEGGAVGKAARGLSSSSGAVAAAVVRDGFVRRPEEIARLEPGDRVLAAGTVAALADARDRVVGSAHGRRVLVAGGGRIGRAVARGLAERGVRVDLVDVDPARCERLAAELSGVRVLVGDTSLAAFLEDIQVATVDAVVACTGFDEVNLVTPLLVRQLAARRAESVHTCMVAHRPGYAELCRTLGIDGAVSTFELLTQAVLEATTAGGRVLSERPLPGTSYSVLEVRVAGSRGSQQRPPTVADLALPAEVFPLFLARGDGGVAPRPTTELEEGDALVMACPSRDVRRFERQLRAVIGEG